MGGSCSSFSPPCSCDPCLCNYTGACSSVGNYADSSVIKTTSIPLTIILGPTLGKSKVSYSYVSNNNLYRIDLDTRPSIDSLETLMNENQLYGALYETTQGYHVVILSDITKDQYQKLYKLFPADQQYLEVSGGVYHRITPKYNEKDEIISFSPRFIRYIGNKNYLKPDLLQELESINIITDKLRDKPRNEVEELIKQNISSAITSLADYTWLWIVILILLIVLILYLFYRNSKMTTI